MTHLSIEQMQIIAQCLATNITVLSCEIFTRCAMATIQFINIIDKLNYLFLRQILVKPTAEFSGEIILAIRKCTGTAKATHNAAGLTVDAMVHLFRCQRTKALVNSIACLQHHQLQLRVFHHKFVGRKNRCRSTANNGYIVHSHPPNLLAFLLVFLVFAKFRNGAFRRPRARPSLDYS